MVSMSMLYLNSTCYLCILSRYISIRDGTNKTLWLSLNVSCKSCKFTRVELGVRMQVATVGKDILSMLEFSA